MEQIKKIDESNYWEKHYKNTDQKPPSDFVKFCTKYIPFGCNIVDLGAGDFRDTKVLEAFGNCESVEPNNEGSSHLTIDNIAYQVGVVYARWFFHSVGEETENKVIDWCKQNGLILMTEFRLRGCDDDSHQRRIINGTKFLKKLIDNGFKVVHYSEGYGFSKIGNDDPYLGRVIAQY